MIYVTCLIKGYVGIHVHTIINSLVQILILFLSLAIRREKKCFYIHNVIWNPTQLTYISTV